MSTERIYSMDDVKAAKGPAPKRSTLTPKRFKQRTWGGVVGAVIGSQLGRFVKAAAYAAGVLLVADIWGVV